MIEDKVSLDSFFNFKQDCDRKFGKKEDVSKLQNFVRELASVKQFNTFEEQFHSFKKEINEKYYNADAVDNKVEGM